MIYLQWWFSIAILWPEGNMCHGQDPCWLILCEVTIQYIGDYQPARLLYSTFCRDQLKLPRMGFRWHSIKSPLEFHTKLHFLPIVPHIMSHRKNSGSRNNVRSGHWFSEIVHTSDGIFPDSDTPFEGYVIPVHIHHICHESFLYKSVVNDGTFPNFLMSFPWR